MKIRRLIGPIFALILMMTGCSTTVENSLAGNDSQESNAAEQNLAIDTSEMFTDRDFEIGYDEEQSTSIYLNGDSAECDSDAVKIADSIVTISDEGTYILSGNLKNGMVVVEAEDTDKLHIILNGVSIENKTSAAIYIQNADKVFITTASGTENLLSNSGEYVTIDDNNIDSAVFSKSDITFNGEGTLEINAAAGHGIVSKDDLVITGGSYDIITEGHGICGKDSVRIANGSFTIQSKKDGIHAENSDDESLGFLYVAEGSFDVTSQGDGLSAGNYLLIDQGEYNILSGGGSANATVKQEQFRGTSQEDTEESTSTKGIKAQGNLILNNGTYTIDSADDAIHSNSNIGVYDGNYQIATGDDALHADSNLLVSSGTIKITESYEGLEGLSIDITGGDIELTSSDDGLNAAGGNDSSGFEGFAGVRRGADEFTANSDAYIKIAGGVINIEASGDGIDSNGSLEVTGGEVYISGPDNGGNGSLDYNGDATISGGIFISAGASQMAQNFGTDSSQGVMMVTVSSQQAGSEITLLDSNGKELLSWTADKAYDSVIISCPEIVKGGSYTLKAGTSETQVTMDSIVYGSGSTMGGQPGNLGGQDPGTIGGKPGGIGGAPGIMGGQTGDFEQNRTGKREDQGDTVQSDILKAPG